MLKSTFLPQTNFRFSYYSNGLATSDFISQIVQDRVNLITQFKKNKIKVFYKTEKHSQKIFSPHYDKLKKVGKNYLDISILIHVVFMGLIKTYPILFLMRLGVEP